MKKNFLLIVAALTFLGFSVNGQEHNHEGHDSHHKTELKKETFKVYGNCGMCEKTIEGALVNVAGVSEADWDKETKQMTVSFYSDVIVLDSIKQKIADVGYDTDTHRSLDEVYRKLAGCCQYERPSN